MPLKPCQRPLRNAVMPRPTLTPPSPYALGAPAPSSGGRVHQSVSPLPSSAFSPQEVRQGLWCCKTSWTSARLRVECCCPWAQPLSTPLQSGVRFFHPPLPARLSARLTAPLSLRGADGGHTVS